MDTNNTKIFEGDILNEAEHYEGDILVPERQVLAVFSCGAFVGVVINKHPPEYTDIDFGVLLTIVGHVYKEDT